MDNIYTETINKKFILKINRASSMNSLDKKTFIDFEKVLTEALASESIKGIIITGAGNKSFISGADIKEFKNFTPQIAYEMSKNGQRVLNIIETADKPIIAAINGIALGGGCEVAMACHIRIAVKHAIFGQPEINLGILPGFGGTQRLVKYLGKTKALELMLTGDTISALEAKELGLINYVCETEELMNKAHDLLDRIISKPKTSVQGIIRSVNAFAENNADGYDTEAEEFKKCFQVNDFQEGIAAFLEKRKPNFK